MTNPQKAKGTQAETAVVRWLHSLGLVTARRLPPAGANDVGDIDLEVLGVNIEVKNHARHDWPAWVDEAARETAHAGRPVVVVAKRRGKSSPSEWYAVLPLGMLVALLRGGEHRMKGREK